MNDVQKLHWSFATDRDFPLDQSCFADDGGSCDAGVGDGLGQGRQHQRPLHDEGFASYCGWNNCAMCAQTYDTPVDEAVSTDHAIVHRGLLERPLSMDVAQQVVPLREL